MFQTTNQLYNYLYQDSMWMAMLGYTKNFTNFPSNRWSSAPTGFGGRPATVLATSPVAGTKVGQRWVFTKKKWILVDFQQCWKVMFIDMFDEYYTKSIQIIYLYQVGWAWSNFQGLAVLPSSRLGPKRAKSSWFRRDLSPSYGLWCCHDRSESSRIHCNSFLWVT